MEKELSEIKKTVAEFKESLDYLSKENTDLKELVKSLQKQQQLTNGLLTQAQTKNNVQNEKILHVQARSLRDTIIIQGTQESDKESWPNTEKKVLDFMKNVLRISDADATSIDCACCIGTKTTVKPRGIVVKFASSKDKDKIFRHVKHLKDTNYVVQEQFPPEINERQKRLWSVFKNAKENEKTDKTMRVNWSLDKLIVNGKTHLAKDDTRIIHPEDDYNTAFVKHAPRITENKSTFRGHAAKLTQGLTVDAVLAGLLSDKIIAAADHNIYAYRCGSKEGQCDDGEHRAGAKLLKLLQEQEATNTIVIMSRWYGGLHLGPKRFELINKCADDALKLLN